MGDAPVGAVFQPPPTPAVGKKPVTSGDDAGAETDVDMAAAADVQKVSAAKEFGPSHQGSNRQRRRSFHTFADGIPVLLSSPVQYLTPFCSSPCAGAAQHNSPCLELTKEELLRRAELMFIGGKGHPKRSGRGRAVSWATNELVHAAQCLLYELYDKRRVEVRWLNETQQLDQEEALAYLLADVLDYELLPGEARSIQ